MRQSLIERPPSVKYDSDESSDSGSRTPVRDEHTEHAEHASRKRKPSVGQDDIETNDSDDDQENIRKRPSLDHAENNHDRFIKRSYQSKPLTENNQSSQLFDSIVGTQSYHMGKEIEDNSHTQQPPQPSIYQKKYLVKKY